MIQSNIWVNMTDSVSIFYLEYGWHSDYNWLYKQHEVLLWAILSLWSLQLMPLWLQACLPKIFVKITRKPVIDFVPNRSCRLVCIDNNIFQSKLNPFWSHQLNHLRNKTMDINVIVFYWRLWINDSHWTATKHSPKNGDKITDEICMHSIGIAHHELQLGVFFWAAVALLLPKFTNRKPRVSPVSTRWKILAVAGRQKVETNSWTRTKLHKMNYERTISCHQRSLKRISV